ncbi:MAG: response regulator [Candidatus Rokubacteria bacterium]|nr:response regulator [Candidatus Rokubacteria bacterium]
MQKLRVLIAHARGVLATRLTAQLESLGHRVVGHAKDGRAAVAAAGELKPDLVIVDLQLPSSDGIEAARTILARQAVPIILLTPRAAADVVRRAREAGVMAHLVTPADTAQLRATLEVALARFLELQAICEEAGDLHEALDARGWVEEAKRVLMRRLKLSEADAFRYLRRQSRNTGKRLKEGAETIVMAEELLFRKLDVARCLQTILRAVRQARVFVPAQTA